jgi:hypothetical protein
VAALLLAFTPVLWSQTVSAEVYTFHTFFVALLIRLLWWWDEKRTVSGLALFVLITGISFGNHMQTVMLAPAVLFIVLSGDYRTLLHWSNFFFLTILFLFALSLYLYLPIRTNAGAAIHWGDPNTLERFLAHVTASAHREGYIFTKGTAGYLSRTGDALRLIVEQFGVGLVLAVFGWLKLPSLRWKVFFVAVVLFDLAYTIFLNIISLEITPFNLSTFISLAILAGIGTAHVLKWIGRHPMVGETTRTGIKAVFCALPIIPMTMNFGLCDQSRNYAAYEHGVNVFRTVNNKGTLFLDGDNNLFPITYCRLVEGMRHDVTLYDRYDIFFKMPFPDNLQDRFFGPWRDLQPIVEQQIIKKTYHGVYLAAYNPYVLSLPNGYSLLPYGILYRVFENREPYHFDEVGRLWKDYATLSFYDSFSRDYMTREVSAYFHFGLGRYFFMKGQPAEGLKHIQWASQIGYNDMMIHSDIGVFLTNAGLFDQALVELEKALLFTEDPAGIYTNLGYYYYKQGDFETAAGYYRQSVEVSPDKFNLYNNLGLALYHGGRRAEASAAFRNSLAIKGNQPKLKRFLEEKGIRK